MLFRSTIRFDYKTGIPLTINYYEKGDTNKAPLSPSYRNVYKTGETFEITSPSISGYKLVDADQATVEGTMETSPIIIDVLYEKIPYGVTYVFSGDAPSGINPPVDSNSYFYGDNAQIKPDVDAPNGWIFKGWDQTGEVTITCDLVVTGTWEKEQYSLDVIYKFESQDDLTVYNDRREALIASAIEGATEEANENHTTGAHEDEFDVCSICLDVITAAGDSAAQSFDSKLGTFYTEYTSADGRTFENIFLK